MPATPEQEQILGDPSRIRVVQASPGSGKTWLVGELIKRELTTWCSPQAGIAALSFTRVGGEEIQSALGHELDHPHFVGTIDAFLFRYVVSPFLSKVFPGYKTPRLIPADWSPSVWTKNPDNKPWLTRGKGGVSAKTYNLFELQYRRRGQDGLDLLVPRAFRGGYDEIPGQDRAIVWKAKEESWKNHGWVTHADAALLASRILRHETFGRIIGQILVTRFPFLIVDELQDTGDYLASCLEHLLAQPSCRGFLVGDPDQSIYEFNGAKPELFEQFSQIPGASQLSIPTSRRCSQRILSVSRYLKATTGELKSSNLADARAFLVPYTNMTSELGQLMQITPFSENGSVAKVVVRTNADAERLGIGHAPEFPSLNCPALKHLGHAVQLYSQGRQTQALALATASIDLTVFHYEGVEVETLTKYEIEFQAWRGLAIRCLLGAVRLPKDGTLFGWQTIAGQLVANELREFHLPEALRVGMAKLGPQHVKKRESDSVARYLLPSTVRPAVPVHTIHGVKGETHDLTVVVLTEPGKQKPCPSVSWWDESNLEERRVAYVAMTRTRGDLVVCAHQQVFEKLKALRPEFVAEFEIITLDRLKDRFTNH